MLYELEPDQSVSGGAWYHNEEFDSEFTAILNQQCYAYLQNKYDEAMKDSGGPIVKRNKSQATVNEVLEYIKSTGIVTVRDKEFVKKGENRQLPKLLLSSSAFI